MSIPSAGNGIMEDTGGLDVENLFEDGTLDQLLPAADGGMLQSATFISLPSVVERIIELNNCGGSQKLAWSRQGQLATISEDGSLVNLQYLIYDSQNRVWKLSESHILNVSFKNAVSLKWSPSGVDLALCEAKGMVSIFSLTMLSMTRLNEFPLQATQEDDELGRPIGMFWFSQERAERPRTVLLHTTKQNSRWSQISAKSRALGPLYQRCFAVVNRQGVLVLFYQRPDGKYARFSTPLLESPDHLYTHAAFGPTLDAKLLIVLSTSYGIMTVYQVQIILPEPRTNPDLQPQILVEFVCGNLSASAPLSYNSDTMHNTTIDPDSWIMTHLDIIPSPDNDQSEEVHPCIHAVYVWINRTIDGSQPGYLISSMVKRWTISQVEEKLHPLFEAMPSKNDSTSEPIFRTSFQRLADHNFGQVVTSYDLLDGPHGIAVTYQDGHIDFINPTTLASTSLQHEMNETSSMFQSGYSFPPVAYPAKVAYSPNTCIVASVDPSNKTSITEMVYQHHGTVNIDNLDPSLDVAIAGLILTLTRACIANVGMDDLIACTVDTFRDDHVPIIARSMYRIMFRDLEFVHEKVTGSELSNVVQKPHVPKILIFHMLLIKSRKMSNHQVHNGVAEHDPDSASGPLVRWLWITVNLRYTATLLYIFYKFLGEANNRLAPDFVDMMCHHIKWSLDLFRFIVDAILEVADRKSCPGMFDEIDADRIGEKGDGSQGLVALLLNCQWSRSFMAAIIRALRAFQKLQSNSPIALKIHNLTQQYSTQKGLSLIAIDKILDPRWYVAHDEIDNTPVVAARQIEMMSTGVVTAVYADNIRRVFTDLVDPNGGLRQKNEIDRLKMYTDTTEWDWVLLQPDERDSDGKVYDIHKKAPIPHDTYFAWVPAAKAAKITLRRCVRCGSRNEDINGMSREWPRTLSGFFHRCICDGGWMVEDWVTPGKS